MCSPLFRLSACQWPLGTPPAFCVSDPMAGGAESFQCSRKGDAWLQKESTGRGGPTHCKGLNLVSSLSLILLLRKPCTSWAWSACCLFSVTSDRAFVSSLGGTYLPMNKLWTCACYSLSYGTAWLLSEQWNIFFIVSWEQHSSQLSTSWVQNFEQLVWYW